MSLIGIQLTPFAPGCADLKSDDPKILFWHYEPGPEALLTWLCDRLERPLDQIALKVRDHQTEIWARPAAGEPLCLMAAVFDGVTPDDLVIARARMLGRFIPSPANPEKAA